MTISLRARIGLGAGVLAMLALFASLTMIWSLAETDRRLETSLAAQSRIAEYSALATTLSTFGVLAYESAVSATDREVRQTQFESQIAGIYTAFDRISLALETDVDAAEADGLNEQSERATRSLGLARMRAQFEGLLLGLNSYSIDGNPDRMRVTLDAFSSQFSPLLNAAIEQERRIYREALGEIEALRKNLTRLGIALGITAPVLLIWFYFFQLVPLLRRLSMLGSTTEQIGRETFATRLPTGTHDEIGLLFARTNQMSARLRRRKNAVEADRADLARIIDDRTAELRAANLKLADADENRRRFFADVSHELRTPLTVILAETELAEGDTPEAKGAALAVIRKRAALLNRRIDDLLRIARSDSGKISLEPEPVDLSQIVSLALEDTDRLRSRAGMKTVVETSSVTVEADANWLRQITAGLIENAVKHASAGKSLTVQVDRDGTSGRIRIVDNGPGVGADDAVFDRFERGQGTSTSSGFGIGLALAKWVVEKQGGHISLQSPAVDPVPAENNPGTMVTLWFPALDA